MKLLAAVAFFAAFVAISTVRGDDLITSLPGAPVVPFKQYAGYLTLDASTGKRIFYWFVESSNNPATDPVILWTNGGPGCSGLIGFFEEHGPFYPEQDGKSLQVNPYSWNRQANMFYIEAPSGVGFSYSDTPSDYNTGDALTTEDNLKLILAFYAKYPQFASNDFFISSESYGGHYMPLLGAAIVDSNKQGANPSIPFKGILVGNPYTDPTENFYGRYGTWWGHSLISLKEWQAISDHCITTPEANRCSEAETKASSTVSGLDPYGLDFPLCTAAKAQRLQFLNYKRQARGQAQLLNYEPCNDAWAIQYLSRVDVMAAIHANPARAPWSPCASSHLHYNYSDENVPMEPVWKTLVSEGSLRLVIFSGDDDSVCGTLGTQMWLSQLGLSVVSDWAPWSYDNQVAGFKIKYQGLDLVTVHTAGHEVPAYQPERAFELLRQFLSGTI